MKSTALTSHELHAQFTKLYGESYDEFHPELAGCAADLKSQEELEMFTELEDKWEERQHQYLDHEYSASSWGEKEQDLLEARIEGYGDGFPFY